MYFYLHTTGKPSKRYDRLNIDWAPTQKMGHSFVQSSSETSAAVSRSKRASHRNNIRNELESARLEAEEEARAEAETIADETEYDTGTLAVTLNNPSQREFGFRYYSL